MKLTDAARVGEPIKQSIMVQRLEINFSEETKEFLLQLSQAEPKHGKWVLGDGYYCSSCGYKLQTTAILRYCPNCGAKMNRKDDE